MAKIKEKGFEFKPSFHSNLDKLCSYISDTTTKIKKVKPRDFEYGCCNTGYNLRFITPENISTFIDNYINALKMKLIDETYTDANKFMVANAKKFLKDNGCQEINSYTVNTKPMYVNQGAQTLSDLIAFVEGEIVKTSIYSSAQIKKRFELVQKDLNEVSKSNFTNVTKRIVDALPKIIEQKYMASMFIFRMTSDVFVDIIGQFILFAATMNALTVKGMWNYVFPKKTLGLSFNNTSRTDKMFVESTMLGSEPTLITLTDGIPMNKTNLVMLREKLPIDINIKNIVLQDQTRKFDEMTSAIKFILTDNRSPISGLLLKFLDQEKCQTQRIFANEEYKTDVTNVTKMFMNYDNQGMRNEDKLFETDKNWLELIVSGNDFIDHNYRRDTMSDLVKSNPILNTLDMIYRVYGEIINDNKELVENIIKVSNIMVSIAEEYDNRNMRNRPLVKDILTVFAEILTRNLLKLYWNNNAVVDFDLRLDDTPVPDFMYTDNDLMQEMFMEANGVSVSVQNAAGTVVNKIKVLLKKFGEWVTKSLSNLSGIFKQKHAADVNLVKNNSKINAEIGQAIEQGIFKPTINNFNEYKVPFNKIKPVAGNIASVIRGIIDNTDPATPVDLATYQDKLLPSGVSIQDIQTGSNASKMKAENNAIRNFVLFGNTAGIKAQSITITKAQWEDIISNINNSEKAITDLATVISGQFKEVSQMLERKVVVEGIQEIIADGEKIFQEDGENVSTTNTTTAAPNQVDQQAATANTNQPAPQGQPAQSTQPVKVDPENSKAAQVFKNIVMPIATSFYTPALNVIRNDFFANSLDAYKGIVEAYQQTKNTNNQVGSQVNQPQA